jgi:hypothetical protein
MRTPAGKECRYFYGDYFRGREVEECRLLANSNPPQAWKADLCATCPVPDIILNNACQSLVLEAHLHRPIPIIFKAKVAVNTFCTKTSRSGFDPNIGCGECHPLPAEFEGIKL